jgi:hypothetical protein
VPTAALASTGWTNITGASLIPAALRSPAVAEGQDGRIYLFGGADCCSTLYNTTYIFAPTTGQWTQGAAMPTARQFAFAVTLPDGRIMVVGGKDLSNNAVNAAELYTPATDSWTSAPPLQTTPYGGMAALGGDGRVYMIGGQTSEGCGGITEAYDPSSNTWIYVASLPTCVLGGAAVADAQGDIVASIDNTAAAFRYDIASNTWTSLAYEPCCLDPTVASLGADGLTYFAGGNGILGYAPPTNTWTVLAAPPTLTMDALLPAPNGQFYSVGDEQQINSQIFLGTTAAAAYAQVSPTLLNFGDVPIGMTSPPLSTTVTNAGTLPLSVTDVSITGTLRHHRNPANYAITGNTCSNVSLSYGVSCTIDFTFSPTAPFQNTVIVNIMESADPYPKDVTVSGTGIVVPTLSLDQAAATVSQRVTVTGTNFLGGEPVALSWDGTTTPPVVTATTTVSGSFGTLFRVPQAISGTHTVVAVGQSSGRTASATINVTPAVRATPNSGAAGTQARVLGVGFGAAEPITLLWDTPRMVMGTATSNAVGTFGASPSLTIMVPTGAATGSHVLLAVDQATRAVIGRGVFTVR